MDIRIAHKQARNVAIVFGRLYSEKHGLRIDEPLDLAMGKQHGQLLRLCGWSISCLPPDCRGQGPRGTRSPRL